MGDQADVWREWKARRKEHRRKTGMPCPVCIEQRPKGNPSILTLGQVCKVDGYKDHRPRPNK